jgi:hypothetical protein
VEDVNTHGLHDTARVSSFVSILIQEEQESRLNYCTPKQSTISRLENLSIGSISLQLLLQAVEGREGGVKRDMMFRWRD